MVDLTKQTEKLKSKIEIGKNSIEKISKLVEEKKDLVNSEDRKLQELESKKSAIQNEIEEKSIIQSEAEEQLVNLTEQVEELNNKIELGKKSADEISELVENKKNLVNSENEKLQVSDAPFAFF